MNGRTVTLHGTLQGVIWWPPVDAQLPVTLDLTREAGRFVNAKGSGLIDAVKAVVEGAGDFQSAKLTADSYIELRHERRDSGRGRVTFRLIEVGALPSLADYVDPVAFTCWDDR